MSCVVRISNTCVRTAQRIQLWANVIAWKYRNGLCYVGFRNPSSNTICDALKGFGNNMPEDGGELEKRVEKEAVEGH